MDNTSIITVQEAADICSRLSGKDSEGFAKCAVTYMSYEYDETKTEETQQIHTITNGIATVTIEKRIPEFFTLDIEFPSSEDTELALFWGRLQEYRRKQVMEPDKNWIFFLNLLELDSLQYNIEKPDELFTINLMNPILHVVTRKEPMDRVTENESDEYLMGGNIVRLLFHGSLVSFDIVNNIDTNQILGDVLRENDSDRYLDEVMNKENDVNKRN